MTQAAGDADPAPAERLCRGPGGGEGGGEAVRALRHPRLRRLQRRDVSGAGQEEGAAVGDAAAAEVQEGLSGRTLSNTVRPGYKGRVLSKEN